MVNVRRGWTDCRAATLTFFFFFFLMLTRRGRGLRERWDKILRWRHSKIHCTHYDARTKKRNSLSAPRDTRSASRNMRKTGSFRLNAHRTVQTRPVWSRSVHDGIFPDYFYTQYLGRPHERRPMASRREQVSALFFVAWTQPPLTDSFPWVTEGANPLKETLTFKKRIFWQPALGSLPAGLNFDVHKHQT